MLISHQKIFKEAIQCLDELVSSDQAVKKLKVRKDKPFNDPKLNFKKVIKGHSKVIFKEDKLASPAGFEPASPA